MAHQPRKRFGQNFLQDTSIIQAIIDAIQPQPSDHMIEIGPGLGALTRPLLQKLNTLTAIEIDTDLHAQLSSLSTPSHHLNLIQADALNIEFKAFGPHLRVVGNLPYNISTPLMLHLLNNHACIEDMHFMLQKEVVDRLTAPPGTKAYGRLSIIIQYFCETECLFLVPPEAFYPIPKVESAVVRLTPYQTPIYPSICVHALQKIVAKAFAMRRKTLANNLKPLFNPQELEALNIDPLRRPEQISIDEYIRITQFALDSDKINHVNP
jgi:16S rRNA (adenine1518-N6/adenine1519-N6)-dimethyltransferase